MEAAEAEASTLAPLSFLPLLRASSPPALSLPASSSPAASSSPPHQSEVHVVRDHLRAAARRARLQQRAAEAPEGQRLPRAHQPRHRDGGPRRARAPFPPRLLRTPLAQTANADSASTSATLSASRCRKSACSRHAAAAASRACSESSRQSASAAAARALRAASAGVETSSAPPRGRTETRERPAGRRKRPGAEAEADGAAGAEVGQEDAAEGALGSTTTKPLRAVCASLALERQARHAWERPPLPPLPLLPPPPPPRRAPARPVPPELADRPRLGRGARGGRRERPARRLEQPAALGTDSVGGAGRLGGRGRATLGAPAPRLAAVAVAGVVAVAVAVGGGGGGAVSAAERQGAPSKRRSLVFERLVVVKFARPLSLVVLLAAAPLSLFFFFLTLAVIVLESFSRLSAPAERGSGAPQGVVLQHPPQSARQPRERRVRDVGPHRRQQARRAALEGGCEGRQGRQREAQGPEPPGEAVDAGGRGGGGLRGVEQRGVEVSPVSVSSSSSSSGVAAGPQGEDAQGPVEVAGQGVEGAGDGIAAGARGRDDAEAAGAAGAPPPPLFSPLLPPPVAAATLAVVVAASEASSATASCLAAIVGACARGCSSKARSRERPASVRAPGARARKSEVFAAALRFRLRGRSASSGRDQAQRRDCGRVEQRWSLAVSNEMERERSAGREPCECLRKWRRAPGVSVEGFFV